MIISPLWNYLDFISEQHLIYGCAVIIVISTSIIAVDFVTFQDNNPDDKLEEQADLPFSEREQVVPPANGITVIGDHPGDRLIAFAPDGRLLYYNDTFDRYHDVDPSPTGKTTIEVVGVEYINQDKTRNFVQRINLTTGETEILYTHIVPRTDATHRWHDVDRLGPNRLVVADIYRDSVFIVNTTTEERTYEWHAQDAYSLSTGGSWPDDWTHVNDVEALEDGRIMVSLRNQDSVVFIRPGEGMLENQTLGAENNYEILYEQHNPDYIPKERGGPAVVVADSQNNRIVEYQRTNGSWNQTWVWSDSEMRWPRDADRLPNGHTLIADSNSNRIIEVNESGAIVWEVNGITNYEVERLGTGDESSGGYSAKKLDLQSRTKEDPRESKSSSSVISSFRQLVVALIPTKIANAIRFITPPWMTFWSTGALALDTVAGVLLVVIGLKRSRYHIRSPIIKSGE